MYNSPTLLLRHEDDVPAIALSLFARKGVVVVDTDEMRHDYIATEVGGAFRNPVNNLTISNGTVKGLKETPRSDDPTLHVLRIGLSDPACAADTVRMFTMSGVVNGRLLVLMDTNAVLGGFFDFGDLGPVATLIKH